MSQFRDGLSTVKANCSYYHPAVLDADIAGFDITFTNPGLRSTSRGFGTEIVGLEFHVRSTINAGWF